MNALLIASAATVLASEDPLGHVLDHQILPGFSTHMLFLLLSGGLCIWLLPLVAQRIASDGTGGRLGGFFESILLFLRDEVVRPFMGKEGDQYLWIIWTFFFFILFCNLFGLIPLYGQSATGNINVTGGLAIVSFVTYHGIGIKRNGLIPYLKANFLVGPPLLWPLMILIETMSHVIKPCALAIRLFANMLAGHTMLAVILGFTGTLSALGLVVAGVASSAAVALTFLEILVAFIQAFIFTFLTTVFLSMAVHPDH